VELSIKNARLERGNFAVLEPK